MVLIFSLIIALQTFLLVVLLLIYLRKASSIDIFHRLRRHTVDDKGAIDNGILSKLYPFIQKISKPILKWNLSQIIELRLRRAGVPLLGGEFIVIALMLSAVAFVVTYMLLLNERFAIIAALIVPCVMWTMLLIRINNRRNTFTEQLCDCLTTVANALRAGYSFQQAVEVVSKEMEPPISEEFARVNQDVIMGINLDTALEQMARRVESSDFDLVVTAVLIQREVGGNLAQVLDSISDTINERIRMKREISALTAQGRLSAMVLLALPFVVGAFMYFFNHDNFMILFEEPMGQMAMGVAVVMEVIGIFVIRRIVDIDV